MSEKKLVVNGVQLPRLKLRVDGGKNSPLFSSVVGRLLDNLKIRSSETYETYKSIPDFIGKGIQYFLEHDPPDVFMFIKTPYIIGNRCITNVRGETHLTKLAGRDAIRAMGEILDKGRREKWPNGIITVHQGRSLSHLTIHIITPTMDGIIGLITPLLITPNRKTPAAALTITKRGIDEEYMDSVEIITDEQGIPNIEKTSEKLKTVLEKIIQQEEVTFANEHTTVFRIWGEGDKWVSFIVNGWQVANTDGCYD